MGTQRRRLNLKAIPNQCSPRINWPHCKKVKALYMPNSGNYVILWCLLLLDVVWLTEPYVKGATTVPAGSINDFHWQTGRCDKGWKTRLFLMFLFYLRTTLLGPVYMMNSSREEFHPGMSFTSVSGYLPLVYNTPG